MRITLKAARVNAGLSQEEVCKKIGRKRLSLWRWESGKDAPPPKILDELCALYGVEKADIK